MADQGGRVSAKGGSSASAWDRERDYHKGPVTLQGKLPGLSGGYMRQDYLRPRRLPVIIGGVTVFASVIPSRC